MQKIITILIIVFSIIYIPICLADTANKNYSPPADCKRLQDLNFTNRSWVYFDFARLKFCSPTKAPDIRQQIIKFKYAALFYDVDLLLENLNIMKSNNIDLQNLYQIIEDAINWARKEKQKSADDLYRLSKNLPKNLKLHDYENRFAFAYLLLAKKKGHQKATEEINAIPKPTARALCEKHLKEGCEKY